MVSAAKHEKSFHLQRESISGVQPPEQSKRRRGIQNKDIKRNLFKLHWLHIPTYLRARVWVNLRSQGEIKSSIPRARERSRFCGSHQYVACSCSIYLRSIRPPALLANCICLQVRSEECLTQHAIIHLSCSGLPCCSCPRVTPSPHPLQTPPPPLL